MGFKVRKSFQSLSSFGGKYKEPDKVMVKKETHVVWFWRSRPGEDRALDSVAQMFLSFCAWLQFRVKRKSDGWRECHFVSDILLQPQRNIAGKSQDGRILVIAHDTLETLQSRSWE